MDTLKQLASKLPQRVFVDAHPVPIDWYPDEDGALFPLPTTHRWHTLEQLAQAFNVERALLCAFPLIWQLEPIAHKTARELSIPIAVTSPQNLPLIRPYLEEAGVDIILTAPENTEEVIEICESATRHPKAIIVIHRRIDTIRRYDTKLLIAHELHLVPGLPLAYQPLGRVNQNATSISLELADAYTWNIPETASEPVCVSFPDLPVPILDLELTLSVSRDSNGVPIVPIP